MSESNSDMMLDVEGVDVVLKSSFSRLRAMGSRRR